MKIFFDTEFIMNEYDVPELLAIGIVREDGQTYYCENGNADLGGADEWVQENVLPYLTGPVRILPQIAREVRAFIGRDPEVWAYYNTYDHLLLLMLLGGWKGTPEPAHVCHDLETLLMLKGKTAEQMPMQQPQTLHHALHDAQWVADAYNALMKE